MAEEENKVEDFLQDEDVVKERKKKRSIHEKIIRKRQQKYLSKYY